MPSGHYALADAPTRADLLIASITEAKDRFSLPSALLLHQLHEKVQKAYGIVDNKLHHRPTEGDLREELFLNQLAGTLSQFPSDPSVLLAVYGKLHSDHEDMEEKRYCDLRHALYSYAKVIEYSQDPNAEATYRDILDKLAVAVKTSMTEFSAAAHDEVSRTYEWLAERGQAPELLALLRKSYNRRNLRAQISGKFLEKSINGDFHQKVPINQTMLGTKIEGSALALGRIGVTLVPDENYGHPSLNVIGFADSTVKGTRNIARHTATVGATSYSEFSASLPLLMTPDLDFKLGTPTATAHANSTPQWGSLTARTRIVQKLGAKLALRMAWKQKDKGDRESETFLEQQMIRELQTKGKELLHTLNSMVNQGFRTPLKRMDAFPSSVVRSTSTHIELKSLFASEYQLGTAFDPDIITDPTADVAMQVHQSTFNNLSSVSAGGSLDEEKFRKAVFEKIATLPEEDRPSGVIPATVVFSDKNPIKARITKEEIRLATKIKAFNVDGVTYETRAMVLKATYRGSLSPKGIQLARVGEVKVTPTSGERSGEDYDAIVSVVDRFFVPRASINRVDIEFEFEGIKNRIALEATGLHMSDSGWMGIDWRYVPKAPKPVEKNL